MFFQEVFRNPSERHIESFPHGIMVPVGPSHHGVTLWLFNRKLLKMTIEIVDFPIDSMVIFDSYVTVYQRVKKKTTPPSGDSWGI